MKKLLIALVLLLATTVNAGEVLDLPFVVVISEPTTDVVELKSITMHFEATKDSTKVLLEYSVYNPNRTVPLVQYSINVTGSGIDTVFAPTTWNDLKEEIKDAISDDIQARLPVQPK